MNTQERLQEIWSQDYINELPTLIKDRGFTFSKNYQPKDILITGFNASFRETDNIDCHHFDFQTILNEPWDNYWGPLKKMIYDSESNIDLRDKSAYLDIFYFREKEQSFLKNEVLKIQAGVRFLVDQINLTQHTIEDIIKPKVIIVKNKESAAYWGKLATEGIIWMGYQLEFIQNMVCGELYRITGLIDSPERIAPEFANTSLENSLVLFTQHINQYTANEKRPTAEIIKTLLDYQYAAEKIRELKTT